MKNSQLAVLSAVILAAALIVAGGNFWLVRSLHRDAMNGGAGFPGGQAGRTPSCGKKIADAVENRDGLSTSRRRAQEKGIKVITWDADAAPDARSFFVNQATPGAAEAVEQSGRANVKVIGLGLPNDNKRYVHNGTTEAVILWNTMDLGYLTVHAAHDLAAGTLKPGAKTFEAGRLGEVTVAGDNILLGQPFKFTKQNIDQFDF